MSRDSDKARELADEFFDHDASTDYSSWDATAKARSAILAAMRYAYQEAAAELEHKASPTCAKCSLESRARDLGAE